LHLSKPRRYDPDGFAGRSAELSVRCSTFFEVLDEEPLMRRTAFTSLLLVGLGLVVPPSARADFILNPANGHYYGLTDTRESFAAAEAEAVALGGHLTAIADQAEQDFVVATFLTAPQATAVPYWIGFTDQVIEGTFAWTSGEPVTFTAWNSGEPNDFGGNEDYAAIGWHFARGESVPRGTWNDTPLGGTSGFGGNSDGPYQGIIELTFNPVPEPASLALASMGVVVLASWRLRRRRSA
jgi:hypothetical protein